MQRKLPPFSALKAFEAAARNGSFARAATELDVTATAVSQHVKGMETWLGEALFVRQANGVELTERAKALLPEASRLLDEMAALLPPAIMADNSVSVTIVAPRALSDGWLGPLLAEFQNENPGITVFLEPDTKRSHPERHSMADLMITHFPATGDSLLSELLFEDAVMPVATKQYRDLMGLDDAGRWAKATLLHDAQWEKDWAEWGASQSGLDSDWQAGPRYPNHWLVLEAAKQGRGVAMAHAVPAAQALTEGALVPLAKAPLPTGGTLLFDQTAWPSVSCSDSIAGLVIGHHPPDYVIDACWRSHRCRGNTSLDKGKSEKKKETHIGASLRM